LITLKIPFHYFYPRKKLSEKCIGTLCAKSGLGDPYRNPVGNKFLTSLATKFSQTEQVILPMFLGFISRLVTAHAPVNRNNH
jgi:hypothetical protein